MKKTELLDGVLIEFGNMVNGRKRLSMLLASVAYLAFACVTLRLLFFYVVHRVINGENNPFGQKDSIGTSIMLITVITVAIVFSSYAFVRFLKRTVEKESLVIKASSIAINTTKLGKTKSRHFEIEGIINISFADKSGHGPIASGYANSLEQGMVSSVNADGNIIIIYDGEIIRCGKDLYSWHAEELNELMKKITHGKLTIQNIPAQLAEDEYNVGGKVP